MERRRFGRRGPELPVVGMGTWKVLDVRGESAEARAHAVVREAFDAGVRVFDSSPMYGEAERVLGEAIRPFRDEVFVATKVWARAPGEAEQQIDRSLRFFGGRIDLYQVHNLSRIDDVLPKLRALERQGAVGQVGLTHYQPSAFAEVAQWSRTPGVSAIQLPLNARERTAEHSLLALAEETGLGVLVMEPLDSGRLLVPAPPPDVVGRYASFGVRTWAQLLLKWVLSDPRVDVILPATGVPGRPTENAEAGAPPWFPPSTREEIAALVGSLGPPSV